MIPKAAVKAFLNRRLDDHRWIKKIGHKALDRAIAQLNPVPDLCPTLRLHQKACFLLGVAFPRFAYWLDLGSGKTLLSLELIRYWMKAGFVKRAIVFIISDKALSTWTRQQKRFGIDIPYCDATSGYSEDKWEAIRKFDEGIIYLTYPGAVAMCSQRVKGGMALDPKLIRKLKKGVECVVLDESTKAGGDSLTHLLVRRVANQIHACYALAGRPFGRDPTLLWRQQFIIDRGETLGGNLGIFRAAFFHEEENEWGNEWSKNYVYDKRKSGQLSKVMRHRSITYEADECVDLPKVTRIVEPVAMPMETLQYYRRAAKQMIEARGNFREQKNAFIRMRQISSGFVGFKDDDTGEKAEVEFKVCPKLDRTVELLEDLPYKRKAVLFYDFTLSGRRLEKAFRAIDYDPIWLWSGTKDPNALEHFLDKDKHRVLIINNRIGAYSLDGLQEVANYLFFYESPVPCIDREQAEHRLIRDGQPHKVFLYDLVTANTVDEKILKFHEEGADIMRAVRRDPDLVVK